MLFSVRMKGEQDMRKVYYIPDAPLMKGCRGMHVDRLQYALDGVFKYRGKNKISKIEPSYYGDETVSNIKTFQAAQGIKITGIYDHMTRQKLREVLHADKCME